MFSYLFMALGTECRLLLYAESQEQADMWAALGVAEVQRIEEKYSRFRVDSTLSQINRDAATGRSIALDEETSALLNFAFACNRKSDGLFDITTGVLRRVWNFSSCSLPSHDAIAVLLPLIGMERLVWRSPTLRFAVEGMELDFGGIGKEYAVDRVAAILSNEGVTSALIDLGGDLRALGPQPDGRPWTIKLREPRGRNDLMEEVALAHGSLATSGDYERCLELQGNRYCHVLNPRTGWPVQSLSSVTVIAPQCLVAGSMTTIAMLKERDGIHWLASLGLPHRWIDSSGHKGGVIPTDPMNVRH